MMFSTNNPIPFTVKDLKKHLEYMDDNMPIRLIDEEEKYLALVGRSATEVTMSFCKKDYFTGYNFNS